MDADGRTVVFDSTADNLVADDENGVLDVFLRDRDAGTTVRVSVSNLAGDANGHSDTPDVSDSGTRVVFSSSATDLILDDTNDADDVFLREYEGTPSTALVSVGDNEEQGDFGSDTATISRNGKVVAFYSLATNLVAGDENVGTDLFVRDLEAGTTERINPDSAPFTAYTRAALSADGHYVAFATDQSLVDEDTNGFSDIYLYDRELDSLQLISLGEAGESDGLSWAPALSADARYVAFHSEATNLVPSDGPATSDVFVYDRATDTTERVSDADAGGFSPTLSGDGRFVTYDIPPIRDGFSEVYLRDRRSGNLERVSVDSGGVDSDNQSYSGEISYDGSTVAFASDATDIVAGDTNEATDIFARNLAETHPLTPGVFVVNSREDTVIGGCTFSHCTLREAILAANAAAGPDTIEFDIFGANGEVQTITVGSALPTITDPVTIDGYTQPGASENTLAVGNDANLLIELNGNSGGFDGLTVTRGASTIRGLVINRFNGDAIELRDDGPNLITGNFIGTNAAGTALLTNGSGIYMEHSRDNTIGGTAPAARNVIVSSANFAIRTRLACVPCPEDGLNVIQGNYIGTDRFGTAHIATPPAGRGGIYLSNSQNLIGGTTAGARNVISTVGVGGITLAESEAHHNTIQGNYIGVDATGGAQLAAGWGQVGITITRAGTNLIGGTTAGAGNVISSASGGISIFGVSGVSGTGNNVVQGNYIGTDATGTVGMPVSAGSAVLIDSSSDNTIGGAVAGAGNVLSRSLRGVHIQTQAPVASGNVVQGNFIGTNATGTGTAAFGNSNGGVVVSSTGGAPSPSTNNTIGGTTAGARNVISANTGDGIWINGADNTAIQGNYIGIAAEGATALGNSGDGIEISSGTGNVVGGEAAGAGNVISANGGRGVRLAASGNFVRGNLIGTNAAGTGDLGNTLDGVHVNSGPNTVGGAAAGARNVISGNDQHGVFIQGGSGSTVQGNYVGTDTNGSADLGNTNEGIAVNNSTDNVLADNVISGNGASGVNINGFTGNQIRGNRIGTNAAGNAAIPNASNGILVDGANFDAANTVIGGTTEGDRNIISGNEGDGILAIGSRTVGVKIQGNYIGTDVFGVADLGNGNDGVELLGGPVETTIGGTTASARNVISGNAAAGVNVIAGSNNTIQGNYIGTNAPGTQDVGNTLRGISISGGADDTLVGGTANGASNLISGNDGPGILISGPGTDSNDVQGNLIGTTFDGNNPLGNSAGITIGSAAASNVVGGLTVAARNVVSGNNGQGIRLTGSSNTVVQGNFVGIGENGAQALGNGGSGIFILDSSNNLVGGATEGSANRIAYNGAAATGTNASGVMVLGDNSIGNSVLGNSIFENGEEAGDLGIDLGGDGVTANDPGDGDASPNHLQNFPVLDSATTGDGSTAIRGRMDSVPPGPYDLEFFADVSCDEADHGEGMTFLGSLEHEVTLIPESVFFQFNFGANIATGAFITATATDAEGNTSEFSECETVQSADTAQPGPNFTVNAADDNPPNGCTTLHCNLREAITAANDTEGANEIQFDIDCDPQIEICGESWHATIQPTTPLPVITEAVSIDATTQPGYDGAPLIELDGSSAPIATHGLEIATDDSLVRGFAINRFNLAGIRISAGSGNSILANYLGTDATGTIDLGNHTGVVVLSANNIVGGPGAASRNVISGNETGVFLDGAAGILVQGNYIGTDSSGQAALGNGTGVSVSGGNGVVVGGTTPGVRNVISGNSGYGVYLTGGVPTVQNTRVEGNFIGVDVQGDDALPNSGAGVRIFEGHHHTIGGTIGGDFAAARNIISGNGGDGIEVISPNSSYNRIFGNYIGTDVSGTGQLGNGRNGVRIAGAAHTFVGYVQPGTGNLISGNQGHGVFVDGDGGGANGIQGNLIGTTAAGTGDLGNAGDGVRVEVTTTFVGGTAAEARNVVSGNNGNGVVLHNTGSSRVEGNYIGTDITGTVAVANGLDGIAVDQSGSNTIGGTATGAGNLVSGNTNRGISVSNSIEIAVQGNRIGTKADGTSPLGNGSEGIRINEAGGTIVGGTDPAAGNRIAFNGGDGVAVTGARIGNRIHINSIVANGDTADDLGIDLGGDGVTTNDTGDADTGPNDFQNFPVLTSVTDESFGVRVRGSLESTPNTSFRLDFYANGACDASGNGEGDNWIGWTQQSTDGSGTLNIDTGDGLTASVSPGDVVTATATASADGAPPETSITATPSGTSEFSACAAVTEGTVDLTVETIAFTAPENFPPHSYTVTVKNLGTATADVSNVAVQGYYSADTTVDEGDSPACGVVMSGTLGPDESRDVPVGCSAPPGSNHAFLLVRVDDGNTLAESDETNNVGSSELTQPGPTFTVNSAADPAPNGCTQSNCTLREAILAANARAGTDSIHFEIACNPVTEICGGPEWQALIQPTSELPGLTGQTNVDGTTQPSYSGVPLVRIDGELLPAGAAGLRVGGSSSTLMALSITNVNGNGLALSGSGHTLQTSYIGLDALGADQGNSTGIFVEGTGHLIGGPTAAARNVISGNAAQGVYLSGAGASTNTVQNNYIGTTPAGDGALGNQIGVHIQGGSNNAVADNVIADNLTGVAIGPGTGNSVRGNKIGTNAAGTADLGNLRGVLTSDGSTSNTIGGTTAADRNLISGNNEAGVRFAGASTNNSIQGNAIGVNTAGNAAIPNGHGVEIDGGSATGNTVGGTASGAGNVISGNSGAGIHLNSGASSTVQGNTIGLDASGAALGNTFAGIWINGAVSNTIGGTATAARNVISGNTGAGVVVNGSGNTVAGNYVGTGHDETQARGNGEEGVRILGGDGNTVGGTAVGASNVIAFNSADGIAVFAGTGNEILSNSISNNGTTADDLGIDLDGDGVTPNDAGDGDTGPNNLQNFPELSSAESGGEQTVVEGVMRAPLMNMVLEFFSSPACDGTHGEGRTFLGSHTILDQSGSDYNFTFTHPADVAVDSVITATATTEDGDTSEFSTCTEVTEAAGGATDGSLELDSLSPSTTAGAEVVPLGNIPPSAIRSVSAGATTRNVELDAIPLEEIPLEEIPLEEIPLEEIGFTSSLLQSALGGIHLSEVPLSIDGGWDAVLVGTRLEGVPHNTITLADVYSLSPLPARLSPPQGSDVDPLTLGQIDLSATPLEEIALGAIALGPTPLEEIPLEEISTGSGSREQQARQAWCDAINAIDGFECPSADSLIGETLVGLTIRGIPLEEIPLEEIPLEEIELAGTPLEEIPLEEIDITDTPLEEIPLEEIPLEEIHLVRSPLEEIPLEEIGAGIVDCSGGYCDAAANHDLGDAATADRILPNVTLGQLIAALTDGSSASLADLDPGLPNLQPGDRPVTLRDILGLLLGRATYDWENLPLTGAFFPQDYATEGGVITYRASFTLNGSGSGADVTLQATVPDDARYVPGSSRLLLGASSLEIEEPSQAFHAPESGPRTLRLTWDAHVSFGESYVLEFKVRPSLSIGSATASMTLSSTGIEDEVADAPPVQIGQTLEPGEGDPELAPNALYFGHLTRGDSDFLRIPIPSQYGSRTAIDLSHLPADYDLVVFGPPLPLPASTVDEGVPLGNEPLVDTEVTLGDHTQPLPPETLQDVGLEAVGSGTVLRASSDNRGTADEHLELISLGEPGEYTIRIDAYEEAESDRPYMLRVSQSGPPNLPDCDPRDFGPNPQGQVGPSPSIGPGVNTLFLVNQKRLGDTHGAQAAADVMSKLGLLAARPEFGVTSSIVSVESNAAVAAAYAAWDANPCSPALANDVSNAIARLLDTLITPAMEEQIENIVIVGGDDIIPFARVPDETEIANERTYASALGEANNQFLGSFAHGFLMTDDLYGDRDPKDWFGRKLYVPERAVGRLVEAPGSIMAQIDQFIVRQGRITPTTKLVTGYDFLIDGAEAVNGALTGLQAGPSPMIGDQWSRQDLINALFPSSGTPPQVNSVNAHFDHYRALPADQNAARLQDDLFTTDDISAGSLDGRLLFTMGCHSGFAAANAVFGLAAVSSDFAETVAANGGVGYIGNTGYGLGDTAIVAYSERLHQLFAAGLRGRTIGKALVAAKQQYIGIVSGTVITPYDEKVSIEATHYGLPMYRYGPDVPPAEKPDPLPTTTDSATGLQSVSFHEEPDIDLDNPVTTPNGQYFRVAGEPLGGVEVTPRRPIQPMTVLDVTQPPSVGLAHGAILEHLESAPDIPGFDAAWSRVEIDSADAGPELVGEGTSSSKLQAITTVDIPGGSLHQQLLLLAGQYRSDGDPDPGGVGIQTVFTEQSGKVYFSSSPDFVLPQFGPVDIVRVDSASAATIGFAVDVTDRDHNGNPGTVTRVMALYRDCNNVWRKSEFSKAATSNRWSGGGPVVSGCQAVSYFIQAVDAAGNVGVTSRKVLQAPIVVDDEDEEGDPDTISATLSGTEHSSGWFTSDVTVELESSNPSVTIKYSVDGEEFKTYSGQPFTITANGVHTIDFEGSDGSDGTEVAAIDKAGPTILITTPKDGAKYVLNSSVLADYTCADAGSGAQTCSGTKPPREPIDTSTVGPNKKFSVTATDAVGNTTTKEVTYEVIRRPILFASSRTGNGDIYAIDPHAATPTPPIQITDGPAIDAEPEWFPNGERIAFTSSRSGNGDIYSIEFDGDSLDQLTSHSAIDTSPAISPDGTKIAFASNRAGNFDIWVMNSDGSGTPVQLTTQSAADLLPAWSSDGTQIAFMSARSGNGDIYTMNADGTSQLRRTTSSGIDSEPAWFNSTIAFSTNRHGDSNFEIYTMTPTGASQMRRTQQAGHDITPAWSADGAKIVFASNRNPPGGGLNFNIFTMEPNGSGQTPVVTHGAADLWPDW